MFLRVKFHRPTRLGPPDVGVSVTDTNGFTGKFI